MTQITEKIIRNTSGALTAFLALNAFGGGYYGMSGAKNIPVEWLEGSPFHNYFIPSLILFVFVGGSSLAASTLTFRKHFLARKAVFICVCIVFAWLSVQVAIIGYVSWMQPVTACTAVIILLLNWLLPANKI